MLSAIILSNAKTEELRLLTLQCINSFKNTVNYPHEIIVIESTPGVVYDGCKTMFVKEDFNYNRYMNIGISIAKGSWFALLNNDLIFHKGWFSEMMMYEFDSMSPRCDRTQTQSKFRSVHQGIRTAFELSGWAIVMKRSTWETIGGLDEDFVFWFADCSYMMQLIEHNINHYLIATSIVTHLGSTTVKTLDKHTNDAYTMGSTRKFNLKYKRNKFGMNPEFEANEKKFK